MTIKTEDIPAAYKAGDKTFATPEERDAYVYAVERAEQFAASLGEGARPGRRTMTLLAAFALWDQATSVLESAQNVDAAE